jgi:hypothetical protein
LLSSGHFAVDGTLIEAWASIKSFRPRQPVDENGPGGGGRNAPADFRGEKRSNDAHRSTTDPDARLQRGVFRSLVDLRAAINPHLGEHNRKPNPLSGLPIPSKKSIAGIKQ